MITNIKHVYSSFQRADVSFTYDGDAYIVIYDKGGISLYNAYYDLGVVSWGKSYTMDTHERSLFLPGSNFPKESTIELLMRSYKITNL